MSGIPVRQVALIGFGEFGGIFGRDLAAAGISVAMFDVLLRAEPSRALMLAKAAKANVRACDSLDGAIRGADLVISAVTASAAAGAAKEAASALSGGQTYWTSILFRRKQNARSREFWNHRRRFLSRQR